MALDNSRAWEKGCDCQTLCLKDRLDQAYNEVRCSRLAEVSGDRSGLAVHASTPLRAGHKTIGILNVAAASWDSFSPRALALLGSVGSQMGAALERARLYDLLQETRIHEQAALLNFTNQLLGRLDVGDLMSFLVEEVRQLLSVDACALLLPDEKDSSLLRFTAATGWRQDPVAEQRRVPADDRTGSGFVMRTQEPITLTDATTRETAPWMAGWLPQEAFESAAIVPLVAEGRSIGALVVDARRQREFQESELRFLQLMANQAALALEKARLHREEIKRQRLEEELSVARQIQLSLLPAACPTAPGWDFAAHYKAARQVGGDFYDFFERTTADGRLQLMITIADVAGKGVPAALFMALSRTTIRNIAAGGEGPAATLRRANTLLMQDNRTDLFLTAFCVALGLEDGRMVYANAGHNPQLWYRAATDGFVELQTDGMVLGVLDEIGVGDASIVVEPNDFIVLYTDGVTEAMNDRMEEFGLERLIGAIPTERWQSASDIVAAIVSAVDAHSGDAPRWDDLTLLVIKRDGPETDNQTADHRPKA
jgi:sigma-B regulation protein RsbU (phosphoserine phosphatase)